MSLLPVHGELCKCREIEGGEVRGEWGPKYVIAVFIKFSCSLGKTANS